MAALFAALVIVTVVYLLVVVVLRLLNGISPVGAAVDGTLKRGETSVWFAAAGVVGAFTLLAALALGAVKVLAQ